MRFAIIFLFLSAGMIAGAQGSSNFPSSLTRQESVTVATGYEIGDVASTDPKVLDFLVQEGRRSIYLHAKGEGFSTLTLWDAQGELKDVVPVTVYGASLKSIMNEARVQFASLRTVEMIVEGEDLRLVGEAPSPADFKRLEAFANRYPQVRNEVTLAKPVLETLISKIEGAIGVPGIRVREVRNRLVLDGIAYSAEAAKRAFEIAKLYAPDCLNLIEVRQANRVPGKEKMVQLDFYFMEIQKSALRTFGIQWAPGAFPAGEGANMSLGGGGGSAGGSGGLGDIGKSLIGFVLNLAPKIRFVKEHGLGRVLENPTLFVKSGDDARFFSGVQVPYYSQESVQFKEVGIQLEAWPIVSGNSVDLKLTATLSSPSPHIKGGINTHTVNTTAYVASGQAVVLGGILSNRQVKTYNRVPEALSTGTALFTLFLSKDFQSSNSELVVFVLPRIVEELPSAKPAHEEWKEMEEKMFNERSMREYLDYMKNRKRGRKKR